MGYLTTFTVYNDHCHEITENPKKFADEIYKACCNPNLNYRSNVFYGSVIPQKTRHADEQTIYVHAGNTVVEMNSCSQTTKEMMKQSPKFFEEMLNLMDQNVKELKKLLKELKSVK